MTLSEELKWRGFVNQTTLADISELDKQPITFYWGVDPSSDSMTIGNLAAAMMVKLFIKYKHLPVLLVGGATGLIGDPDGKADERQLKSIEEIANNKRAIVKQYRQLFSDNELKIVDNYEWFKDMGYLEFLREVGKHIPLRQMLSRDFVQARLKEGGSGISYAEFSYVLIQAYDFLKLYQDHGVTLQVCGSDQWGNSIAGVDLIRRKTGGEAHVYSTPLVVNKTTGKKFGKSEEGAIWLDPNKTTPTAFYQFWINTDDAAVEDYLKIYTELDKVSLEEVMLNHNQEPHRRIAQKRLAREVTELVHGKAEMEKAEKVTELLTGQVSISQAGDVISDLRNEISHATVQPNSSIVETLVASGLAASNTEARRLLDNNAVSINGEKVNRVDFVPTDFQNGRLLIRRGKAYKDSALIELG